MKIGDVTQSELMNTSAGSLYPPPTCSAVRHVVLFSGGVGSWAAAKRVVERHGTDGLVLLFADVLMEDSDLYRFIREAASNVGGEFICIAHGLTPWQLAEAEGVIPRSGLDVCSRVLKREFMDKWIDEFAEGATVHIGIDWTEQDRLEGCKKRRPDLKWSAPLCDKPLMSKADMLAALKLEGIAPPRLYCLGFQHNNCGGFCVKAGQAAFANLLRTMPERYRWHESQEEHMRGIVGDHSMMVEKRGGVKYPLTMRRLRERIEQQGTLGFDGDDWGGCGCAL